jgi:hypothetical protein
MELPEIGLDSWFFYRRASLPMLTLALFICAKGSLNGSVSSRGRTFAGSVADEIKEGQSRRDGERCERVCVEDAFLLILCDSARILWTGIRIGMNVQLSPLRARPKLFELFFCHSRGCLIYSQLHILVESPFTFQCH